MPVLQIMKEVGSQWQNLKPHEKEGYQKKANADKVRYKEELKEFEKEVEKLQVNKPAKGKGSSKSKKKAESKVEEKPERKSPQLEKSDFRRKFLESDVIPQEPTLSPGKNSRVGNSNSIL